MKLRKITAITGVTVATLATLMSSPVFAEENSKTETDPAVELTAGKDSDKNATVSKGEQALTDNSQNKDKESDKNTTVLKKEETEKKEEPKKEEPKAEEKVPEKLPEAGFESIGLGLLSFSALGAGTVTVAKRKSKNK